MSKRNLSRVIALQGLYQYQIHGSKYLETILKFDWVKTRSNKDLTEVLKFSKALIQGYLSHSEQIDQLIEKYDEAKSNDPLSPIVLSILRLSIYSILFQKDIHINIIIHEAINLAKKFADNNAYQFINGILDKVKE